jgi:hypothetical protein
MADETENSGGNDVPMSVKQGLPWPKRTVRWLWRHWIEVVVTIAGVSMFIGLLLMINGILALSQSVNSLHEAASKAEKKADAAAVMNKTLLENSKRQWELLQQHNPELAVPQVVEPTPPPPIPRQERIIVPEKPKQSPLPTPKTRTVIKYKARPKPTPWKWPWDKKTR